MKNVKVSTALALFVLIAIGLGLSLIFDNEETADVSFEEGDIGFLGNHEEIESGIFETAFHTTFQGRVNVTDPDKVVSAASFVNIYEDGEQVAQYFTGALHYTDDNPFDDDTIDFAAGGFAGLEEDGEGFYWSQVILGGHGGGLSSGFNLDADGELQSWATLDNIPVNAEEQVIYGVAVIEGTGQIPANLNDSGEFDLWAANQGKVLTFELLISSEEIDMESWDNRTEN